MTNGERLRAMADEGLALFLGVRVMCENCPADSKCGPDDKSCSQRILEWLREEEGNDQYRAEG